MHARRLHGHHLHDAARTYIHTHIHTCARSEAGANAAGPKGCLHPPRRRAEKAERYGVPTRYLPTPT
ncbi:hypothetical protein BDY21DRAFT_342832 [Lineolata rhizophorae]|uniref:Uncharacterized protein n=1 Tax=Lineolata rhizophorae TaxID=578093 RepID=A0A6A6P1A1_9PEZI|nr:hypothetical protein BDY21DRAFT_342832 [Lineolata rhizophorae]